MTVVPAFFRSKLTAGLAVLSLLGTIFGKAHATISEDLYSEIIFLRGIEPGAGGRALALGGAYRALSDDLSGLYWNPAGLASVRRIEIGLGLSQSIMRDEAQIPGHDAVSDQLSRTRLNELGLVFPFPAYRGSLVFAVGYHQVHSFDSFGTFTSTASDSTFQGDELESGRLGLWSLGMAIDLSQIVSAGVAVRLWTGYNDYTWNAFTQYSGNTWSSFDQSLNSDLSGFNLLTGVLLKPLPWMRIGATLETPLKLSIDESYSDSSGLSAAGEFTGDSFSAGYSYHVSRPFRGGLGMAFLIGPVGFSADVGLNDWSQISYADEPPFLGLSREEANREVARTLKPQADFHAGLEYWLPFMEARLQAGYAYIPSPFQNEAVISNKNLFSGGFSILIDPSLQVQTALTWALWDRSIGWWQEDLQLAHLLVTLSYRI